MVSLHEAKRNRVKCEQTEVMCMEVKRHYLMIISLGRNEKNERGGSRKSEKSEKSEICIGGILIKKMSLRINFLSGD